MSQDLDDDDLDLPPLPPALTDEATGEESTGLEDAPADELDATSEPTPVAAGRDEALDDALASEVASEVLEELQVGLHDDAALGDAEGLDDEGADGDDEAGLLGPEYGWSGDEDVADVSEFLDEVSPGDESSALDDGGEEGVDERGALTFVGDDEVAGLPPLDADGEDGLADDLELDDDARIDLPDLGPSAGSG